MTEIISRIIASVIMVYLAISAPMLLRGLLEGGTKKSITQETVSDCFKEPTRIILIFPTYKLGCYLGSTVGSVCYDYNSCKELKND